MGQGHQGLIPTTLSEPSLTCPSSSTSHSSSPGAKARLPARPSTQAAKGVTEDSVKWHMSPKLLTWQRGSLSLWQWLRQSLHCGATQWALKNGQRGSTGMSLPLTLSLPFFLGSRCPAFHKLCTPIYTLLPLSDFNGVCLSPIEKKGESSSLRQPRLLWKCTFISTQCSRVLVCKDMGEHAWKRCDVVDSRPPAAFSTQFGYFFPFPSFFLKVFIVQE